MSHTYQFAILGGTFDHFHLGHERLISAAFKQSGRVTIGILVSPLSPDKSFVESLEDYVIRKNNLKLFLRQLNVASRATIIPIHDIYGTSLTDQSIQAIFVTEETRANTDRINEERQKINLPSLTIIIVPYATDDNGEIISSGRIRAGEIDRQGHSYLQFFLSKPNYRLPKSLRPTLSEPIGPVFTDARELVKAIPEGGLVIAIGDIVSTDLRKISYPTAISIIDYRTERRDLDKATIEKYFPLVNHKLTNPAGTINPQIGNILTSALAEYQKSHIPQVIAVEGEEDLLALPAILLAPLNSYIIYGQSHVGMVLVKVTEELKSLAKHYLEQF